MSHYTLKPASTGLHPPSMGHPASDHHASDAGEEPHKLVGVISVASASGHSELLAALEQVFPIRFQEREPHDLEGLDGVLAIGDATHPGFGLPDGLSEAIARRCPCLVTHSAGGGLASPGMAIELAQDEQLARLLWGRSLSEELAPAGPGPTSSDGNRALAMAGARPVWWRRSGPGWLHHSAFGLGELASGEALRDRLRAGHFMGLLPLLHLLRHVCQDLEWDERPLRAAFMIDDPNLHSGSYGYLNYRQLVAHAERHGYHVGLATVPLDGWMCSRRTASLVRSRPKLVSLLMHGNSHLAGELGRLTDDRAAEKALAQALCRASALERRCGIPVEHVMAPPHEICSTAALAAMFRLGFEGACIASRHPWRDRESLSRLTYARTLKWHPTDLIGAGLPIVPRHPIEHSREELVFAALLHQPLIVFAHHWNFADGLDLLEQAANDINGLGDVSWESVASIARNCYFTRRSGETLHVQMHSRRVIVDVPDGVGVVRVSTPSLIGDEPQRELVSGAADLRLATTQGGWVSDSLPASPGASVELRLASGDPVDPAAVSHPRRTPWPIIRRMLVESRDRARPLLRR
ncbi:MAG TPA: hypothetical protein VK672_07735 [Solirubrobacteraceae bacterium]|nr:hypothetical protein [Solirubrobacteraceae bacterium]